MTHALLGRKLQMSQLYADDGRVIPVTIVEAGPCPVTQVKTVSNDGYNAFQIGFGRITKLSRVAKPMKGHFKKAKAEPQRTLREVKFAGDQAPVALGQELTVKVFEVGDTVDVLGVTKGKGFQGTVKRHRFHRGPESHGSMNVRKPGSIGSNTDPGRVLKGVRMAGHMGNANHTAKNLQIVRIDAEKNLLFVKGSIPGFNGAVVLIKDAKTGASDAQRKRALPAPAAAAAPEAPKA